MDILPPIDLIDNALGHGEVLESQVTSALANVPFSSQRKVYRLDRTAGSLNIVDDTTVAISGTSNAFSPFGANVLGAAATIKVYDSIDGVWASNELSVTARRANGTVHASVIACLKETGWCSITFVENANRQNWRPSADPSAAIPSRKYIRVELDDGGDKDSFVVACGASDITAILLNVTTAGGTAAAVRLAEVVLVRRPADIKWVDVTTGSEGVQGDIGTPYTPAASTWIPIVGSETWYGLESIGNVGAVNRGGGGGGASGRNGFLGGSGVVIVRFATQTRSYQALQSFASNAAAVTGGLLVGQFYTNTTVGGIAQVA